MSKLIPSKVWLPKNSCYKTVFSFLKEKFPQIPAQIWEERMQSGKVRTLNDESIPYNSPYLGDRHIIYFREIKNEITIPFIEKILFEDENILLIDKPHFLPIHPAGSFVKETLVHRLRSSKDNSQITPIHRIDRLTAGLILFSKSKDRRKDYQNLFENRKVKKEYLALSTNKQSKSTSWHIKNRITTGDPWFTSKIIQGEANSESYINIVDKNSEFTKFSLSPISGKKHQLRLHLASIGYPILNDPLYPCVQKNLDDNYDKPLQLLAYKLSFTDPLSGKKREFKSQLKLLF